MTTKVIEGWVCSDGWVYSDGQDAGEDGVRRCGTGRITIKRADDGGLDVDIDAGFTLKYIPRAAIDWLLAPADRYVAVKREDIKGRPASLFIDEAWARQYAKFCNAGGRFIDDVGNGVRSSSPWAVVDTHAGPPS